MDALTGWVIRHLDGPDAAVDAVLARHHAAMRAASPEESCHVMTAAALRDAGARVYAIYDAAGAPGGVAALKPFADAAVELKSMHTLSEHRGKGLGRAMLQHLIDEARAAGATSVWLETGSEPGFAAARRMYETAGFEYCPPFGPYVKDPLSVFMTRSLIL